MLDHETGHGEVLDVARRQSGSCPRRGGRDEAVSLVHRASVGRQLPAPCAGSLGLGIAVGAGTDVAIESAGIILVRSNPLDIVKIVKLSRATYSKMIQNLIWATGYNVIAIPLAMGVLAPFGITLDPAVGAVFMSLSTVIVAFNAQLLRRLDLSAV